MKSEDSCCRVWQILGVDKGSTPFKGVKRPNKNTKYQ